MNLNPGSVWFRCFRSFGDGMLLFKNEANWWAWRWHVSCILSDYHISGAWVLTYFYSSTFFFSWGSTSDRLTKKPTATLSSGEGGKFTPHPPPASAWELALLLSSHTPSAMPKSPPSCLHNLICPGVPCTGSKLYFLVWKESSSAITSESNFG